MHHWYLNHRVWRPVTEDECDYALNAVPPITLRRGFIASEPYCHTRAGKPGYNCFRDFYGVPHTMLATVEEHCTSNFPVSIGLLTSCESSDPIPTRE